MISILLIILGIGGLIFVHELGHFLVAKWSGVKVEVFSVGFGWKFLSYKWGETQYALSAIPLGGYVKMAGELPNEDRTGAEYELHSKSPWKRFWIFSAGSLMNLLVVFPLCALMFWIGVDRAGNQVGAVKPGSPEWEAGMTAGQELTALQVQKTPGSVDDPSKMEWGPRQAIKSLEEYRETVLWLNPDQHLKLFMSSEDGNTKEYVVDPPDSIRNQSIAPFANEVHYILDGSPAARAGIQRGDRIVSVNEASITNLRNIQDLINHHVDPRLRYVVRRNDGEIDIREIAVDQGTAYLFRTNGERHPIYQLSDDLNVRDRLQMSEGDRIVRINDIRIANSSDTNSPDNSVKPLDYEDVQLERVPAGPLPVIVHRPVTEGGSTRMKEKTFSLYPNVSVVPEYHVKYLIEPVVHSVQGGSPADQAGLQKGDRILSIDGHAIPTMHHLNLWVEDRAGDTLELTYKRDGTEQQTTIVPQENVYGGGQIGVVFSSKNPPAALPELPEHSRLAQSGFQKGDRIVAFYDRKGNRKDLVNPENNDEKEKGVQLFKKYLAMKQSEKVTVEVKRTVDGSEETRELTYKPGQKRSGKIGLSVGPDTFQKRTGVIRGLTEGISRGVDLYALTFIGIQKMFQDAETAKQGLAGPVRIASISYRAVQQDVGQFLKILAMISISLGVLNLLPLPPLDGGHILFLFIEVLRGKPLSEDVLYKIQLAGFLFFIMLFIVITYNDFANIFGA